MVCYTTQRKAEEAISEINKGTEWHAEIYQNRYTEINEGRNKKTKENDNSEESKRNKTNKEKQNHQSRKGVDKWQEEMDNLKFDISQIKEYIKAIMDNKEWLKNLQNNEEGKNAQNKERKEKQIKKKTQRSKKINNGLRKFTIVYQNIRGLKLKVDSVQELVDDCQPCRRRKK